jgi:hypothetical protein
VRQDAPQASAVAAGQDAPESSPAIASSPLGGVWAGWARSPRPHQLRAGPLGDAWVGMGWAPLALTSFEHSGPPRPSPARAPHPSASPARAPSLGAHQLPLGPQLGPPPSALTSSGPFGPHRSTQGRTYRPAFPSPARSPLAPPRPHQLRARPFGDAWAGLPSLPLPPSPSPAQIKALGAQLGALKAGGHGEAAASPAVGAALLATLIDGKAICNTR